MGSVFDLPYGKNRIRAVIDGDLLAPRRAEPVADETAAVYDALEKPIGAAPLRSIVRPGERVAIVVNDITRLTRTDLILPPIVNTLSAAGIPDRDLFIVFALGIHRRQTDEERRLILGDEMFSRIRSVDHISTDEANLVTIGTTSFGNRVEINREVWEADRIVLTGEIIYHLIAGYSGGRKSLVPGVAGFRTTTFNHRMIFHPDCRAGKPPLAAAPVSTKPCASTETPQPSSQVVSGSAPTNMKMLRAAQWYSSPLRWLRQVAPSRPRSGSPCRLCSSVYGCSSMFGAASMRSIR